MSTESIIGIVLAVVAVVYFVSRIIYLSKIIAALQGYSSYANALVDSFVRYLLDTTDEQYTRNVFKNVMKLANNYCGLKEEGYSIDDLVNFYIQAVKEDNND